MAYKYLIYPFASSGDVTPIPDQTQVLGTVSYQQGFGARYSLPYPTDADALPVPRTSFNQLMEDITTGIQQYQNTGTPPFITDSMNLGTPYAYTKNAYALFDAADGKGLQIYQSTADANNTNPTPGSGNPLPNENWILCDNNTLSNVINHVSFGVGVVQNNVVYLSTVTGLYEQAIANGTGAQSFIGLADVARGRVITFGTYAYLTGLTQGAVYYLSDSVYGALTTVQPSANVVPVGVALSSTMFTIQPGYGGRFAPAGSVILPGTVIDWAASSLPAGYLICNGNAVSRTTYSALFGAIGTTWGAGDGSTTFNLPNLLRRSTVGEGGPVPAGSTLPGITAGTYGGAEMKTLSIAEMPSHNHTGSTIGGTTGAGTAQLALAGNAARTNVPGLVIAAQGGSTAFCLFSPVAVVRKLIKF